MDEKIERKVKEGKSRCLIGRTLPELPGRTEEKHKKT
jgi:hypothetical protein